MDTRSLTVDSDDTNVYVAAYKKCLPRFFAIPTELLMPVTFDIPWATTAALGSLPEVMKLRDRASRMPEVRIDAFDDIRDVTLALRHANALFLAASESADELVSLAERAYKWRAKLRAVIKSYVLCRILHPKKIENYSGLKGYRNVATDLLLLTSVLIDAWAVVEAMCPCRRDELDTAANLAAEILSCIALRDEAAAATEAAADIRNRASADFLSCWREIGRTVSFLRWYEGDANEILPALFSPPAKHKNNDAGQHEPSVAHSGGSPFIDA